jgi:hypothetical protein
MLASGRSTRIEQRRLTEKNEWPVGRESSLGLNNVFKRTADVNGGSPRAFRSSPGRRSTQGVIDLERAGAVTETLQPLAVMGGKFSTCDAKNLSRSDAGENEVSFRQLCNLMIDFNLPAKIFQIAREGIWQSLGATAQNRPATAWPAARRIKPTAAEAGASNDKTD